MRDREAREAVLLEAEIDRARRRDLDRRRDALAPGPRPVAGSKPAAEAARQLLARLEVRLGVGPAQVGQRVERPAVLDRGQDVVELAVLGRSRSGRRW